MPKKGFRKKFEKHRKTKNFFAKIRAEIQRQKTGKKISNFKTKKLCYIIKGRNSGHFLKKSRFFELKINLKNAL